MAQKAAAEPGEAKATSLADTTIRVDVSLLDNLMNLVGELVLARNQIMQLTASQQDTAFLAQSQRLNLITTELQESAMQTRMQAIGNVWSKFPRVVRDLSLACGKSVRLEMEGEDTELDKTLIESIRDPLTHLVRNSVDHGIETSAAREAAGKPSEGVLSLRAFHEGGQVNIEIADDGAGIDPEKIRAKALAKGLITAEDAARLGDREVVNLIFLPGFSTAEAITNVSGRGVGMDVVKTNIERIGGSVDVTSVVGEGATFRVKIPLTLAIIPALVVTSSGDRYAIPQASLLELVRLEHGSSGGSIETIQGTPVYRLRGNLLPLVDLQYELGGRARTAEDGGAVNIVVLQADDRQFGLVVEGVQDTAEIVVKPLSQHLKAISSFAGATIMGDGRVGLILDVMGLAQRAKVVAEVRERALADALDANVAVERQSLLLFRTPDDGRMAIPLIAVDRLEEFARTSVEYAGDWDVVQYREDILPLVHVSAELPERRKRSRTPTTAEGGVSESIQVIVHVSAGRRVGLVVDQILDIVEENYDLQPAGRAGVLGTVVIHDRVTEVLDLVSLVSSVDLANRPRTTTGV